MSQLPITGDIFVFFKEQKHKTWLVSGGIRLYFCAGKNYEYKTAYYPNTYRCNARAAACLLYQRG